MDQYTLLTFLNGATMMGSLVASLFFYRFRMTTNDRFFTLFSLAFLLLAIDRVAMLVSASGNEASPVVYLFRFFSFLLIIAAVVDKNRVSNNTSEQPG